MIYKMSKQTEEETLARIAQRLKPPPDFQEPPASRFDEVEFYLRHWKGFLCDFWALDNRLLTITIEPRSDVESGMWYVAVWWTAENKKRTVMAQRERLMRERIVKEFLSDYRELVAGDA